jgi:drug/metabolite transporter (DMT)-like permease
MSGQILTALLAVVFLGEMPPLKTWIGIFITVLGIGTVLWSKVLADKEKMSTGIRGVILGILFMLSMSVSVIIAKPALASVSTVLATFIRLAAGTVCMALFGMSTGKINDWINPFLNKKMLILFISSVFVVTFGGFWLSLVAIKYVDVAVANTLGATEALFVLPLSYIFLKERIEKLEIAGTLLAVCGVLLICTS